jgi:colanic acid biosynthesis glycosyl transferase WcaI
MQLVDGLTNVMFFPLQPLERLNELLNLADIHFLPQRSDAEDLVMPSKLTNMMASGRPVIATAMPGTQIANVLVDSGIVVRPDDVDGVCAAIISLVEDSDRCTRLGNNGRIYAVQHWGHDNVLSSAFAAFKEQQHNNVGSV